MSWFSDFLFGSFLVWAPSVFFWAVFALALIRYFFRHRPWLGKPFWRSLNFRNLVFAALIFRLFYAFLEMVGQYYIWSGNPLTKFLLNSVLSRRVSSLFIFDKFPAVFESQLGYFLFYSYGRFWLNVFVAFLAAFVFYVFLKFLKKYRERFFEEGELTLGFLLSFLAGWPGFLVFLPLTFVLVVLLALFRRLFLKETYTTLGLPMILACFIVFVWGDTFVETMRLTVFKI